MIWHSVKSRRDPLSWALLGFVAAYLLINFLNLFVEPGFAANTWALTDNFVAPWLSLLLAATVALALWGQPSTTTRTLVAGALGCIGVALLLGLASWVGAMVVDDPFLLGEGSGKTMLSLHFLVQAFLMAVVGYITWLLLRALPAPQRTAPAAQPGQPGQPGRSGAGTYFPQYGGYPQQGGYQQGSYPQGVHPQSGDPYGQPSGQYGQPSGQYGQYGQHDPQHSEPYGEQYGHTYGRAHPGPTWYGAPDYPQQPPERPDQPSEQPAEDPSEQGPGRAPRTYPDEH